jgi:hypothetical protein
MSKSAQLSTFFAPGIWADRSCLQKRRGAELLVLQSSHRRMLRPRKSLADLMAKAAASFDDGRGGAPSASKHKLP